MENLQEKADALDRTAQSISKYTLGWVFIILVFYSWILYKAGKWGAEESSEFLIKENERLVAENKAVKIENTSIYRELLEGHGIITKQREVIKIADSAALELKR